MLQAELDQNTDNEELFKQLRTRPVVAWPTVILLVVCLAIIANTWYLCLTSQWSLWLGFFVNTIALYYIFSPMHDAMHQAVFRNSRLNDLTLALTVLPIAPLSSGQFMRMMHMQHHRFTNEPIDPDHDIAKDHRFMFTKWFVWGHIYNLTYKQNLDIYPNLTMGQMAREKIGVVTLIILFILAPMETLMLMFLPGLAFAWLIAAVFMYLPHRPHNVLHKDDPYRATIIREGWEWLLCPLMAYQNYHLVHHLYPTVPFYRYKKVWDAKKNFHMSQNPAIVKPLQLNPD